MEKCYIGLDLGGTKLAVAAVTKCGNIIYRNKVQTKKINQSSLIHQVVDEIRICLKTIKMSEYVVEGIGIGVAAIIDKDRKVIVSAPNLPIENFNIVDYIKDEFGIPVYMDNDANVGALCEYYFGRHGKYENMVYLTISTGIGAGAILNGKLYRGSTNNALNVGHTTIEKNGHKCNCGNVGCAETMGSGTAIAINYREKNIDKSVLLSAKEIFDLKDRNDGVALEVINECLEYIGIVVSNLLITLDPDIIILDGGVGLREDVMAYINKVIRKRCYKTIVDNCMIIQTDFSGMSGVLGSAALCLEK